MRRVFLIWLFASSCIAAERWSSPDRFYSITPPEGWTQQKDESDGHSSFAFISPDKQAEIRISATYNLVRLPAELPDEVLSYLFPDEVPATPIEKIRGAGWDGLRREYTDTDKTGHWFAIAARHGTTVVLLTMRAPVAEFEHFRPVFKSTYESLKLGE